MRVACRGDSLRLNAQLFSCFVRPFRAVAEARPEARPEAMPRTSPEAKPEAGPETKAEEGPEAEPELRPEATPEAGPEAGPEAAPVASGAGIVYRSSLYAHWCLKARFSVAEIRAARPAGKH